MLLARDIARSDWPMAEIARGIWTPSRPIPGPFIDRLFDAWAVLRGKAEAVKFETGYPR
jgi:hypothetical protein